MLPNSIHLAKQDHNNEEIHGIQGGGVPVAGRVEIEYGNKKKKKEMNE